MSPSAALDERPRSCPDGAPVVENVYLPSQKVERLVFPMVNVRRWPTMRQYHHIEQGERSVGVLARRLKRYQVGSYHPHRLAFAWWYMGYAATGCLHGVLHLCMPSSSAFLSLTGSLTYVNPISGSCLFQKSVVLVCERGESYL